MAKGNLLMGTLRGKLGDSVMFVKNGQQCYRKLRKDIYNPRTAKQLIQRAIAATVLKAYGQGKDIFDHSFENKRVGGANQSRFVSLNMRRLRQYVARDINYEEAALDCQGKCVSPKSLTTTPFAFQISEGRLTQNLFIQGTDNADGEPSFKLNASSDALIVKDWLAGLGIRPGDIFTFVAFGINRDYNYFDPDDAARLETETTLFGYVTLEVIDYSQATDTIANGFFSTIFQQVSGSRKINMARDLDATVTLDTIVGQQSLSGYWVGTLGCIRSRKNSRARSTSYMLEPSIMPWGVSSTLIVDAWQNTQILADSDLILEGGGAYRAPAQPDPSNPRSLVGQNIPFSSTQLQEYFQRAQIGDKAGYLCNGFLIILEKDDDSSGGYDVYFYRCSPNVSYYLTRYQGEIENNKFHITAYSCEKVEDLLLFFEDIRVQIAELEPSVTLTYKGGTDIFELPVCATEF